MSYSYLARPGAQEGEALGNQRRSPVLAALAVADDVSAGAEIQVVAGRVSAVSSETRNPVVTASTIQARSRHPAQVLRSGAPSTRVRFSRLCRRSMPAQAAAPPVQQEFRSD